MKLDREKVKELQSELDAVLQKYGAAHKMKVTAGPARYTDSYMEIKVTVACVGENGVAMTKEAKRFLQNAAFFGLQRTDLNRSFDHQGHKYTITGMRGGGKVTTDRDDGKIFLFRPEGLTGILK